MARWAQVAATGETIEMVEETWTLAAEMVCMAFVGLLRIRGEAWLGSEDAAVLQRSGARR